MIVVMVQVRVMAVFVDQGLVAMPMRMRFARRVAGLMRMPVMRIMRVPMLVQLLGMGVQVLVRLGEVQVYADGHRRSCQQQPQRQALVEYRHSNQRADERRGGAGGGKKRHQRLEGGELGCRRATHGALNAIEVAKLRILDGGRLALALLFELGKLDVTGAEHL